MAPLMALIAIFFLGAYFVIVCVLGYIIFSPFKDVSLMTPRKEKRFTMVDLLATFLPFTIGYTVLNGLYPDIAWNTGTATFFCVVAFVITGVSWFYGMRLLWRMQIDDSIKRIMLLGIVMPAGFVLPIVAIPLLFDSWSGVHLGFRFAAITCIIFVMRFLALWIRAADTGISHQVSDA